MLCEPEESADVVNAADVPLRPTVPRLDAPSMKVTLPLIVPDAVELTDAVNVTLCPCSDGLTDDVTAVVVAPLTATVHVPVIVPVTVSVAVTVCVPSVTSVK